MSLWGGRFQFEEKSVTHRDYDDPGEGLRADVPLYPPGIFVGKFGRAASETTVRADFQPKQRVHNPAYTLKQNFRLPRPLIVLEDADYPREGYGWSNEEEEVCSEPQPLTPSERSQQWPPAPLPEWCLPAARQPYLHSSSLRVSGERKRLTSTYTEDLGCVRPGETADFALPPPGLLSWGLPQRRTEYLDNFSGEQIRAPGQQPYPRGHLTHPRASCPRWESSYHAMCRETLEAPSWLRDFLATPPNAAAPTCPNF